MYNIVEDLIKFVENNSTNFSEQAKKEFNEIKTRYTDYLEFDRYSGFNNFNFDD